MKLKAKIFLLAIVPFAVAIGGIEYGVRQQATTLAHAQHATLQAAYMSSKEIELRHYVELAQSAVAPYYDALPNDSRSESERQQLALDALHRLDFRPDGYFFVYTMRGKSLMHPRQPDLVGRDLWTMRDPAGALTIQQLIREASRGGGYVRYVWQRPSTGQLAPKLGYVMPLARWGWMIGTGIYLEDVETALARIDDQAAANIDRTVMWIGGIALAALAVIAVCGAVLNISEHRSADAKLKRLARQVVESQEHERARLSRELHDGISQMLVSVKLLLESALARFERSPAREPAAEAALSTGLGRLAGTLREVRRISHALRPAMLDDLGLAAALEQLARELDGQNGIDVRFESTASAKAAALPDPVNTVLFRIAQEALNNIARHANAARATLGIDIAPNAVSLVVSDNGRGFDAHAVLSDPASGLGLRNMRERLDALGGTLAIHSELGRTVIAATVPLPLARPICKDCPMISDPARIVLVDDHPLVRDGLRARLEAVPHLRVTGEAGNGTEALALAADEANRPDLVLMDVGMAGMSGIELAAHFHERFPAIRVLMLSMHDNIEYVTQAVRAGASGYVLKDSPAAEIIHAIDAVLAGKTFFSAGLAARMIQARAMQTPVERLTPRERDVLDALARGLSSKQIAQQHGLSVRTVETHRLNLKRKLSIDGQAELIKFAVENRRG